MKKLRIILQYNSFYYILLSITILFALINVLLFKQESTFKGNETTFSGVVSKYVIDGNKLSITFNNKEKLIANYYFKSLNEKVYYENTIKYGSIITIEGELTKPLNNTIPNTFNYHDYLYNHHIFYIIKTTKVVVNNNRINIFYKLKNKIKARINNNTYLNTFILNDKSFLDNDIYSSYQSNGIAHLFAISGMHISLFALILAYIIKKFRLKEVKGFVIISVFLIFYAFITNFGPSVLRAILFFILYTFFHLNHFNLKKIYILYLTFCILVFIDPYTLFDIGFQYSFITTFGLLLNNNYNSFYLKNIFLISLRAFLFGMPLTIYYFNEINILSIVINIFFVPLISLLAYPMCLVSFIFPFLISVFNELMTMIEFLNSFFNKLSFFKIIIPQINILVLIILYFLIFLLVFKKNKKYIILIITIILFIKLWYKLDNNTYIYFLDVGQGDSIVIKKKDETIMVDTGGISSFSQEEWKVREKYNVSSNTIKFLKSINVNSINYLFLTHGDNDHLGDANYFINHFKVNNIILNDGDYNSEERLLLNHNVVKKYRGDFNLELLKHKLYDNENDNSLIVYLKIKGYYLLFMGDASTVLEKELNQNYQLKVDFLKVGHHGAKTSTSKEFVQSINPRFCIISVGRNNLYSHPNQSVLDNMKNCSILRTDKDGTIELIIDNNNYTYNLYKP